MIPSVRRTLTVALALAALAAVPAAADPPGVVARLNLAEGPVSFRPGSLDDWAPAAMNYPFTVGDHLWADDGSRAELHVGFAAIRLDGGTEMSFLNLDDQTVQLSVTQGTVNVRLRRLDPGDAFEIDAPNSVVTLLQPGSYTISVTGDDTMNVAVRNGQAEVTAAANDFTVPAGQVATVSGNGSVGWYLQPAGPFGAWEQWCASRDGREDQLVSLQYVSRDMIGYEDLDDNGTWTLMAGYGPVWAPRTVPLGWAPYKYGHWAWVSPWGWTWIDEAPWGFAPFHYGRWAFLGGRWVWVPGTVVARPVYAPALVVFVGNGPDDSSGGIGWFPLGPREVYMPPYGASPAYVQRVNVTQVTISVTNIQQFNVTQVTYVNRTAPSAVTVVPRQSFTTGQPAQRSSINFSTNQVRTAPILGFGATVAPQRESVIGGPFVVNNPARQPPPQVVNRPVYGRIAPAPAPAPFVVQQQPMAPVTVYRQPPAQPAPQPGPVVRQQRPIIINPWLRPQGPQPQFVNPQPMQPQPIQPQPIQPQPRPGFAPQPVQPQPQPLQPQPIQPQPRPGFAPQPVQPQPQPLHPQPIQPQPRPGFAPQPVQPRPQPLQPQPQRPQGQPQQPQVQPQQPQVQPQQPQVQPQQPQVQPQQPQVQPQQPQVQPQQPQQPQVQPQPGKPQGPAVQPGVPPQSDKDKNKEKDNQGRGQAQSLLNELKNKTLPGVQGRLEAARKNPAVKLDYAALSGRINSARSAIASAESTLSTGNSSAALQQAQSIQAQLAALDQQISQAMESAGGGGDQQQRPGGGQGKR
jgi:hypothetical protein